MATLTITVSDKLLASLQKRAATEGTTPEAIAAADVEETVLRPGMLMAKWAEAFEAAQFDAPPAVDTDPSPPNSATDPFLMLAGFIKSDVPDAAQNHDYYLGEALAEDLARGHAK